MTHAGMEPNPRRAQTCASSPFITHRTHPASWSGLLFITVVLERPGVAQIRWSGVRGSDQGEWRLGFPRPALSLLAPTTTLLAQKVSSSYAFQKPTLKQLRKPLSD